MRCSCVCWQRGFQSIHRQWRAMAEVLGAHVEETDGKPSVKVNKSIPLSTHAVVASDDRRGYPNHQQHTEEQSLDWRGLHHF